MYLKLQSSHHLVCLIFFKNAAQAFQCFIDEVLHGLHFTIDGVLVASTFPAEHQHHLWLVLQRFHEHGR